MALLYQKVSLLTKRRRKKQSLCEHEKEGNVLTDSDKVKERWKEYIGDLCDKNNKPQEMYILRNRHRKKMSKDHPYFSVNLKQHSVS